MNPFVIVKINIDRYGCGQKHYEFHPNWELRGKTYINLSYDKKHKKQMKELARHNEAGFTERFVKDTDKIQKKIVRMVTIFKMSAKTHQNFKVLQFQFWRPS
jgi:hypothetical protein